MTAAAAAPEVWAALAATTVGLIGALAAIINTRQQAGASRDTLVWGAAEQMRAELRAENAELRHQVETLQLRLHQLELALTRAGIQPPA